jgi:hypothetical protein
MNNNNREQEQGIQALFPRRFILRPGVAPNRFTCRHPKQSTNCSCQGAAPPPEPTTKTTTPGTNPTTKDPTLQRIEQSYQKTLVQMLFAVRSFPEAAAAIQQILTTAPPHHQPRLPPQ